MLRQALRLIAIFSFTVLMCSCTLAAFSIALNQGIIEGSAPVGSQGNYSAADYFNTTPGYGVEYHVTDSYGGDLEATVWAVNQSVATAPPENNSDFFTTLVDSSVVTGSFSPSALAGYEAHNISAGTFHWYNRGMPVSNQGNFYRLAMLPTQFSIPESWSYDKGTDGRYFYSINTQNPIGDHEVNSVTYPNCIKVEIQNDDSENGYLKGRGYYIISPGIGIVELLFNRSDTTQVSFQINASNTFATQYTVSGIVEDNGGSPVQGIEVHLSSSDMGLGSVTDANGNYSLTAHGPDFMLYVGYDADSDEDMEIGSPTADYPVEHRVSGLTGDRTGQTITLPP